MVLRAGSVLSLTLAILASSVSMPALAACVSGPDGQVNCSGDLTGGVTQTNQPVQNPVLSVNVQDLTSNIAVTDKIGVNFNAPPRNGAIPRSSGQSGGYAQPSGNIVLNVSTGTFAILTKGDEAYGIYAASIGGFGADGYSDSGVFSARGGHGGGAAAGGNVAVNASGVITTQGDDSYGIFALSVGGSGGNGGRASGAISSKAGDGGPAGMGGAINIVSAAQISTRGEDAVGILAQSVGGNGGAGGSASGLWSKSGGGDPAADGNTVEISQSGRIVTQGVGADGILAQSIGGFGGRGGSASGLVAYGSSGSSAGNGGTVKVTNTGTIEIENDVARGLLVQSIGGGGGHAGSASGLVALGASGVHGGNGGTVVVDNSGAGHITTYGENGDGIYAQSVGGGGGDGSSTGALVGIGGAAGAGGNGGTVTVTNSQTVTTHDRDSTAIYAQSIGGGGGDGGNSSGLVSIGGSGGNGGHGGVVSVTSAGNLLAQGQKSHGIFAQSIGGGGGDGGRTVATTVVLPVSVAVGGSGGSGGNGSAVSVVTTGSGKSIATDGEGANAIFAQSIGGGGGVGSLAVSAGALQPVGISVAIGGSGGGGGNAEKVSVNNAHGLSTKGANAAAIYAQSVGGGGGKGGFSFAGSMGQLTISTSVGGTGGTGGSAEDVTVTNSGSIATIGDLSHGLLAQSIGGGGGTGGGAVAASYSISVANISGAIAVAVGGKGGEGNVGAAVEVTNTGTIKTGQAATRSAPLTGNGAHAIFAQSIGGGGGSGGFAGAGSLSVGSKGFNFSLGLGGSGGTGGAANSVEVDNDGRLVTLGNGAHGIYAQSIGGGGGDGGMGLSANLSMATDIPTARVGIALGGAGGSGGVSDQVWVDNSGDISTSGANALGIKAQSIGGGGGSGGLAVTGNMTLNGSGAQASVSVGGNGGAGNTAGLVNLKNEGQVTTTGADSVAILAQSIGGGGGNGGAAIVGSVMNTTTSSAQIGVTVGGKGGTGAKAGTVDVSNAAGGVLTTSGFGAHGIQAQSIGGGGGKGGLALTAMLGVSGEQTSVNVGVSVGGNGGSGGAAAAVKITNAEDIAIKGNSAVGIFAQSIGGGGGDGGGSITGLATITNIAQADAKSINVNASVGGVGGNGNVASTVTIANSGDITTGFKSSTELSGGNSHAIYAQSIGGGGGIGGRANAINLMFGQKCTVPKVCEGVPNAKNNLSLTAAVGGNGGDAGHGAAVTVTNSGELVTHGIHAHGIYAQSVGGGGGDGGNGHLGWGEILPAAASIPMGIGFYVFDQAPIYKSLNLAVGGTGGADGDGAAVDVSTSADITTHELISNAIIAQSIGGGGGTAGRRGAGGEADQGPTGKIGIGGGGGDGGNGGTVTLKITDDAVLTTHGAGADAIIAQSIGGGGGIAGSIAKAGNAWAGLGILSFTQNGGGGGSGDEVNIALDGSIVTTGLKSNGIFAQSIGGGGGAAGNGSMFYSGTAGDEGEGGPITIVVDGSIRTSGNFSTGIFAQSDSGSGTGGEVDIEIAGEVNAGVIVKGETGAPASTIGVLAKSTGPKAGGDISVYLAENSSIQAGRTQLGASLENTSIGLMLVGGANNTIENHGTLSTADGVNGGYAIYVAADPKRTAKAPSPGVPDVRPTLALTNSGVITGNIALNETLGRLVNDTHGLLATGRTLSMAKGSIVNNGTISPGGAGFIMTTSVSGGFEQTATGKYAVDIDLASQGNIKLSDRLDFAGAARLAGVVEVQFLNSAGTIGNYSSVIATSSGKLDSAGLTVVDRPAVDFVLTNTGSQLNLGYTVDFRGDTLLTSDNSVGDYLNALLSAPLAPELEAVMRGLMTIDGDEPYAEALSTIEPADFTAITHTTMASGQNFTNAMMSCKQADGPNRFDAEGQCAWGSLDASRTRQGAHGHTEGFTHKSLALMGGLQAEIADQIQAGLGFGVEQFSTQLGASGQINGVRVQAGAVVKTQLENTSFSAAINAGASQGDATRHLVVPGARYELSSDQTVTFVSATGRVAHTLGFDDIYLRPALDIGLGHITRHGYVENGGPLALNVSNTSSTYLTLTPSIEIGGEFEIGDALLRPFARLGLVETLELTDVDPSAHFAGQGIGNGTFSTPDQVAGTRLDLTAGSSLIFDNGAVLRLSGDLKLAPHFESYGVNAKLSVPF